ncbi:MAG: ribose-5-phosphate isomerase RpiA [Ktedonobacteraceae bacterium]|nr:ribose-5-phosphate isomerase RpiA [Ktedonobacteraceae bacterium]
MQHETEQDTWKRAAGEAAAELVETGMVIGLGSGSTAEYMVQALARRIQAGLHIVGAVPTSLRTEQLARDLGVPLTDLDRHPELDLDLDGADEIDPQLYLIKGGGGALLREKVVASAARRFVVIADVSKQVQYLGYRFPLPIETLPFAVTPVRRHLETLGAAVQVRQHDNRAFLTDNGNVILDCTFTGGISDPVDMEARIRRIVGVVESGLFLHMAAQAIIGGPQGVMRLA